MQSNFVRETAGNMPELPEVECVRRSIQAHLQPRDCITRVVVHRKDLRFPVPKNLVPQLLGQTIWTIRRRAKYLLFETAQQIFLSHLGMSGSWRFASPNQAQRKHDHLELHFASGQILIYHDPRRFGFVDLFDKKTEPKNRFLQHLGLEPLTDDFSAQDLRQKSKAKKAPIKNFLMDQTILVGVGNIYASEILFQARVRPTRSAKSVRLEEWEKIIRYTQKILTASIISGGTTLQDYVNAKSESGKFQKKLFVYGRKGESCRMCKQPIQHKALSGRSTFWCRGCQK